VITSDSFGDEIVVCGSRWPPIAHRADALLRLLSSDRGGGVGKSGGTAGGAGGLTDDGDAAAGWSSDWKVLVLDRESREIVSPLLTVPELRAAGVTLTLSAEAPRDAIPDVHAVYYITSGPLSIRLATEDLGAGRYRDATLAFTSSLTRSTLEELARSLVSAGAVPRVARCLDTYTSFVSLQSRLFTAVGMSSTLQSYASHTASEASIAAYVSASVSCLASVCATAGVLPVIVSSRGGPAQMIASALSRVLQDLAASPATATLFRPTSATAAGTSAHTPLRPFASHSDPSPPVLVVLDRTVDLATPLCHSSTYEALLHDTHGPITANRVTLTAGASGGAAGSDGAGTGGDGGVASWLLEWALGPGASKGAGDGGKGTEARVVTFTPETDPFWAANHDRTFPQAVEAQERDLAAVMAREADIRRRAGVTAGELLEEASAAAANGFSGDGGSAAGGGGAGAGDLAATIESLPALLKQKKMLETHTATLHAVMTQVAARLLPHFHEAELPGLQGAAGGVGCDRAAVLAMVRDGAKGTPHDRLRLAAIHLLTAPPSVLSAASASGGTATSGASGGAAGGPIAAETATLLAALIESLGPSAPSPPGVAVASGGADAIREAFIAHAKQTLHYCRSLRTSRASLLLSAAPFLVSATAASGGAGGGGDGGTAASMLSGGAGLFSHIISRAAGAVRGLVGTDTRLPLTRIVSAIVEGKPAAAAPWAVESYAVYNPRVRPGASTSASAVAEVSLSDHLAAVAAASMGSGGGGSGVGGGGMGSPGPGIAAPPPFSRSTLLFVAGGIAYPEVADVSAWARTAHRTVVVGGTEITHPSAVLTQLAALGTAPGVVPTA